MTNTRWQPVLRRAAQIVGSYDTSVTLRQLFYRLVSEQLIPNSDASYKGLSAHSAQARRDGWFPNLIDRGRTIHEPAHWNSPHDILDDAARTYRRDRTSGQPVSLYLCVEKDGLVTQLQAWFGTLGLPILCPRGYTSQTYADDVAADVERKERSAVLLHGGDFDASGEDILRDFVARTDCWTKVVHVALTDEQVATYQLPENKGKETDSRSRGFTELHGRSCQVEIDALPPEILRSLYQSQIDEFWDASEFENVLVIERAQRRQLIELAEEYA